MTYNVCVIFPPFTDEKISLEKLRNLPKVLLVSVRAGEWRKQLKEHFGQQIINFQWLTGVPTLLFRNQGTLEFQLRDDGKAETQLKLGASMMPGWTWVTGAAWSSWGTRNWRGLSEQQVSVGSSARVKPSQGHRDQSGHGRVKRILGEIGC